ncbi:uncharacterized protein LOC111285492 [Durio zibethinus]|uniref:Uncharacterized protein LOC111285492 n=1 Tax=Durio zibethinus TaxID=66656 RepID=A0A6P5XS87_DURZI|nr:uncharacterized protein LOC111285492 [Durio zibethinus]
MYFQSTGQNQRPRGFNVKQAFKFTLTLAVCIWLLYQFKHSNNEKDVGSLQSEGNSVMILGRKGDVELSDKGLYVSDLKDITLEAEGKQKDRGGGDDDLDGIVDEKGENESLDKGNQYIHGDVKTKVEEGKKMELEIPYNISANSEKIETEMRDNDNEVSSEDNSREGLQNSKRIVSKRDGLGDEQDQKSQNISDERGNKSGGNLVEQGDDKDLESYTKELQRDEETSIGALKQGKHDETGSSKENEDKNLGSKEITKHVNGTENATVLGSNEVANQLHGFRDENGVPQGGNDLVEFTLAKSRDGQAKNILHQETVSSLNHTSQITKGPQIEEGAPKSERNAADTETETQSKKEGSKSDAVLDVGIDSESKFQIQK